MFHNFQKQTDCVGDKDTPKDTFQILLCMCQHCN